MKPNENSCRRKLCPGLARLVNLCPSTLLLALLGVIFAQAVGPLTGRIYAQVRTVYGVSTTRHTTVVSSTRGVAAPRPVVPPPVVVARPAAVALPAGYMAVLPAGYRTVYVHSVRYYTVGGIYYRPQFYQGRTVYVRVHL